jgi:hypothetical protein
MTSIKTLHGDEGNPTRIKYDGECISASFAVENGHDGFVAVLDSLGSTDFGSGDVTAYVDLGEVAHAVERVSDVPYIEDVSLAVGELEGER